MKNLYFTKSLFSLFFILLLSPGIAKAQCNAPTALNAANITATSADLSWSAVSTAFSYEGDVTLTPAPPTSGVSLTGTTALASTLLPNTVYYFHLRSICATGNSAWTTYSFTTLTAPPCTAPTGLTVSSITTTGASFNWNPVIGFPSYEAFITTTPAPPASGGTIFGNAATINTLSPNTTYYIHVRTECGGTNYSAWTTQAFTTLPLSCAAPTGLNISGVTFNGGNFTWNAVTGAVGYEAFITTTPAPPASGSYIGGTSAFSNTLNPSTTYYFHVRTDCGGGTYSSWVTQSFTTTAAPPCNAPTGLVISGITASGANFNWNNASGSTGYEWDITTSSTPPPAGSYTGINNAWYNSLSPSTTYYFHVRTECNNGFNYSGWTTQSFTTLALPPCNAPTGLTVSNITATNADFNWNAIGGAAGYEGWISTTPTPPAAGGFLTGTSANAANGLTPGTTFYLHIRTFCNPNYSAWTTTSFTTLGGSSCLAPTAISISNITSTGLNFSWTAVSGATGYETAVTNSPVPPASGAPTTATTGSSSTLTPATTYYVHVRTQCSGSSYSPWTTQVFTTATAPPCSAPATLTAGTITTNSATFTWGAVTGATGYEYIFNQNSAAPSGAGTPATAATATDNTLNPNTNYYLHARTVCGAGNYSSWTSQTFTTAALPPCAVPGGFAVNNVTSSTADISWNAVSGAAGYEYAYTASATPPASGNPTSALNITLNGLNAGSNYYAHVRSNCGSGNYSNWSTQSLFTQFAAGIDPIDPSAFTITAYPNPVGDVVHISIKGTVNGKAHLMVIDMSGKLIKQIAVTDNNQAIQMTDIAAGIYNIRYVDASRTENILINKK